MQRQAVGHGRSICAPTHILDMTKRSNRLVNRLPAKEVIRYEIEKARCRTQLGLGPAPVTERGGVLMTELGYNLDENGCLLI